VKQPRPKVEPIRNPTLFEMEELEEAGKPANTFKVDRPFYFLGFDGEWLVWGKKTPPDFRFAAKSRGL